MMHEVIPFCVLVLVNCEISFKKSPTNEKTNTRQKTESSIMEEKNDQTPADSPKIKKREFSLPNVKELAKQFTLQSAKETSRSGNKQKLQSDGTPGREPELDYSTVPVSEIISNLQQNRESTPVDSNKHVPCNVRPKTRAEICRKTSGEDKKIGGGRFNGKEVHSLTARSISKEFREGLKNSSRQSALPKMNRAVTNGENEQQIETAVAYQEKSPSPTQSIDLKNMKKFWEEMITANGNATKQK